MMGVTRVTGVIQPFRAFIFSVDLAKFHSEQGICV